MASVETIRKINKNIVHDDGTIDTFDKQLIQLMSGVFDTSFPLVIAEDSVALNYIDEFAIDNPLVMNVTTVIKLKDKHDIGYEFVSNCEEYLKQSVLAFDSLRHDTSKIILLDQSDDDGCPMIAICRENKTYGRGGILLNEITSIYDRNNLISLIIRSYDQDKRFYKNEKTEQYLRSIGSQLPKNVRYALSSKYNKSSFTKSQVEEEIAATQNLSKNQEIDINNLEIKASFHSINKEVNELYFLYEVKWQDQVVVIGLEIDKSKDSQDDKDWIMQIEDKMEEICSKPSIDEYSELTRTCIKEFNNKDSNMVHPLLFGEKAMEVNEKDWSKDDVNDFEDECKQWIENDDVRVERMDEFEIGLIANIVASSSFWTSFALEKDSALCKEIIEKLHERNSLEKTQELEEISELQISR